ncbi:MAG: hypothetical protein ABEK02_01070 [Haloquadratum sp.]
MVTVIGFIVRFVTSIADLVGIFVFDVLLGVDPLTAISFLVGGAITTATVAYLTLLALGALANQLAGVGSSARESTASGRAQR